MSHEIKVLKVDYSRDARGYRNFTATIDGIMIAGKVQLIDLKSIVTMRSDGASVRSNHCYRLHIPRETNFTKHPDYKEIRMKLLLMLASETGSMTKKFITREDD